MLPTKIFSSLLAHLGTASSIVLTAFLVQSTVFGSVSGQAEARREVIPGEEEVPEVSEEMKDEPVADISDLSSVELNPQTESNEKEENPDDRSQEQLKDDVAKDTKGEQKEDGNLPQEGSLSSKDLSQILSDTSQRVFEGLGGGGSQDGGSQKDSTEASEGTGNEGTQEQDPLGGGSGKGLDQHSSDESSGIPGPKDTQTNENLGKPDQGQLSLESEDGDVDPTGDHESELSNLESGQKDNGSPLGDGDQLELQSPEQPPALEPPSPNLPQAGQEQKADSGSEPTGELEGSSTESPEGAESAGQASSMGSNVQSNPSGSDSSDTDSEGSISTEDVGGSGEGGSPVQGLEASTGGASGGDGISGQEGGGQGGPSGESGLEGEPSGDGLGVSGGSSSKSEGGPTGDELFGFAKILIDLF